jgi:methyltransferase (TIGR00027 family)
MVALLTDMDPAMASATAAGVAVARGAHRSYDQPPWVLDDPFALLLVGPQWAEIQAASEAALPPAALRQNRASIVARSRYAEDRLISGGYRQYVILGSGLDSFAWRRADLIGWLRLIEVDQPASQARKLARIAELGLPVRDGHLFAAVDFEAGSLCTSPGAATGCVLPPRNASSPPGHGADDRYRQASHQGSTSHQFPVSDPKDR